MPLDAEWRAAWQALGAAPDAQLLGRLLACYQEPHRHYHTLQHLDECLTHFALLRDAAEHPGEVAVALWFHDAIYDTRRSDNEARSADWARTSLLAAGVAADAAERVHRLVLATQHNAAAPTADARITLDVDLWILAAPPARFDAYEEQIRREYRWVPEPVYRTERRKVLEAFAVRPHLYGTALFQARYEPRARDNLRRALARL